MRRRTRRLERPAIGRRSCLQLLASGFGLLTAPALASVARGHSPSVAPLGDQIRALFSDPGAARALGERYLAAYLGAEADALALAARLQSARPADATGLRQALARQRQADAARRAFAIVDGWVLPKAEAQVCALTVLL